MEYRNGNLISSTERGPSASGSSGIFNLNSHLVYKNVGKWPGSFVTNGLILKLDAGDPASYSGSGATWTDLSSSGNDATMPLQNGPTYSSANSGYFTFDGTDDYAATSGSQTLSSATFVGWIYRNGSQSSSGLIYGRAGGLNSNGVTFLGTTNNLGYTWHSEPNTYTYNSGLTPPDQQWCMFAVAISSSSADFYLYQSSGLTTASNSVSHGSTTVGNLNVGRDDYSGGRHFNGRIAAAYVYNRALTSSELQLNFDANKGRYGL